MLEDTSQRKIPLLIHGVLLIILIRKSIPVNDFAELHFFFLGSLVSTTLALIMVYFNYKVSLHMIGVTALTVFTMGISWHFQVRMINIIMVLLLCSGLVGSSRLVMKAHSGKELILGSLIGSIPQAGLFFLWL
jgi:membrane-associated phospholipid phosphatase